MCFYPKDGVEFKNNYSSVTTGGNDSKEDPKVDPKIETGEEIKDDTIPEPPTPSDESYKSPGTTTSERPDPPAPRDDRATLVPTESGTYIELGEDGVPRGEWKLNEDGVWIFDEYVPLGDLPQTGDSSPTVLFSILALLSVVGVAFLIKDRRCRCDQKK